MAIEQLGESLLSDIRDRNERAAKKARKKEEKDAMLGLGVSLAGMIGNQILESKANAFFNNEKTLQKRLQVKNNYLAAEQDVTDYTNYQKDGLKYLYDRTYADVLKAYQLKAPAGTPQSQIAHMAHIKTMSVAEEQSKGLEERYKAASEFIQTSNADPLAYDKALLKSRPTTVAGYLKKGIAGIFAGGADSAQDKTNAEFLKKKADAYYKIRSEGIQPRQAFETIVNSNESIDWKTEPLKYERGTYAYTNEFGEKVEKTVDFAMNRTTGQTVSVFSLDGNPILTGTPFNETKRNIQTIPDKAISNTQMQVQQNTRLETLKVFETYVNEVLVKDSEDKDRIKAATKQLYGEILLGSKALQRRIPDMPEAVATQLSAEMQALNIKNKMVDVAGPFSFEQLEVQPGKDLFLAEDSYSPFLALAAIEELETRSKNGERLSFSRETLSNLRANITDQMLSPEGQKELGEIFTNMSESSKKNYFDWMSQYKVFTVKMGSNQVTILDTFKMVYAPTVLLEKDKDRLMSRLPTYRLL
jgi:hypothetical protein